MQLCISYWPSGYEGSLTTHMSWRISSTKVLEKIVLPSDKRILAIWKETMGDINMIIYDRTELTLVVLLPKGARKTELRPFVDALSLEPSSINTEAA